MKNLKTQKIKGTTEIFPSLIPNFFSKVDILNVNLTSQISLYLCTYKDTGNWEPPPPWSIPPSELSPGQILPR